MGKTVGLEYVPAPSPAFGRYFPINGEDSWALNRYFPMNGEDSWALNRDFLINGEDRYFPMIGEEGFSRLGPFGTPWPGESAAPGGASARSRRRCCLRRRTGSRTERPARRTARRSLPRPQGAVSGRWMRSPRDRSV